MMVFILFLISQIFIVNAYSENESLECKLEKNVLSKSDSKVKVSVTVKPPQRTHVDVIFSSVNLKGFPVTISTDVTGHGSKNPEIPNRNAIWEAVAYWYDDSGLKAKADCGSLKKSVDGLTEWSAKGFEFIRGTIMVSFFLATGAGFFYGAIWGYGGAKWYSGRWGCRLWLITLIIVAFFYSNFF